VVGRTAIGDDGEMDRMDAAPVLGDKWAMDVAVGLTSEEGEECEWYTRFT
jgi:hypothetical protein